MKNTKKEQKKWEDLTSKEKKQSMLSLGAIVLIGVFLFKVCTAEKTYDSYKDLSIDVTVIADMALVNQLKYPDGWAYEKKKVTRLDSITYHLDAIVLAKNGFGVRSRLGYQFEAKWVGTMNESHDFDNIANTTNWQITQNDLFE